MASYNINIIKGSSAMSKLSGRKVGGTIGARNGGFGRQLKVASPPEKNRAVTTEHVSIMSPALLPQPADQQEIGIVNFLKGKNYFVTGATGFLAKVLIEKILRSQADVGKMYLLIKAKDKEAAMKRLKNEIIESEVFKCVQQKHGKSYLDLMMSKLVPVVGDISKPDLGMDAQSIAHIIAHVDVIVSSAASTAFDERFDVALDTNTRAPGRLITLAKKCNKLCLFMHISTAYTNGERQGLVPEKPFLMGQSIAGDLDLDAEINLASETLKSLDEKDAPRNMKDLGLERARRYGWENVYVFTKAMGEMVINNSRGDIPVVIIRPSVVESTYREPFPGWIQGNRMLDPLILSFGKGLLPVFSADPTALIDVVPADMVVNATIAAMAKHATAAKPEIHVYHVASSRVNPIDLHDLFRFSCDHFTSSPLVDSDGNDIEVSEMDFIGSADEFSSYMSDEVRNHCRVVDGTISDTNVRHRVKKMFERKAEKLVRMVKIYEPYMFYRGWFDNGNMEKLIPEMSEEERVEFGFDMRAIDWRHFVTDIHIPGLKKHVMKIKDMPN